MNDWELEDFQLHLDAEASGISGFDFWVSDLKDTLGTDPKNSFFEFQGNL